MSFFFIIMLVALRIDCTLIGKFVSLRRSINIPFMKKISAFIFVIVAAVLLTSFLPLNAAPAPAPQYSTNDDTAGRSYTGYFIEDGQLKNTQIVIKLRRLRSYWNGVSWVDCTSKIFKSDLKKTITEDDPDYLKFLAKFPSYVTVDNKQIYFNPQEN